MNPSYIAELLVKHLIGTLNEEEDRILKHWLELDESHPQMMKILLDKERLKERWEQYQAFDIRLSWEEIKARIPELSEKEDKEEPPRVIPKRSFIRNWAALWIAVIVLVSGVAGTWWILKPGERRLANIVQPDVVTAQFDGDSIDLSAFRRDWHMEKGNATLSTPENGLLVLSMKDKSAPIDRVILRTPRGKSYQLMLPDSSILNLNADSRVEVGSAYGHEPSVTIAGEVYFLVHPRKDEPFIVDVGPSMTITAKGTAFNVKAYAEDSTIRTDLMSGHLEIRKAGMGPQLLQAQQALTVDKKGKILIQSLTDTATEIPWIHDRFVYKKTPIKEILQDLSRWYNVEILYRQEPAGLYSASGSRKDSLRSILDQLQETGYLHFEVADKKVFVSVR